MAQIFHETLSCAPSRRSDVYVYAIAPISGNGIAAITSADELLRVDRGSLQNSTVARYEGVPIGVASLSTADEGVLSVCAGSDGLVAIFDNRNLKRVAQFTAAKGVNAVACKGHDVAFSYETIVAVWDRRGTKIRWQNSENNDEITALDFHPSKDSVLLGGGDDGLVSIFDTRISEEDDSLLQAVNHGPIHRAGFFGHNDLYALSSDQNLAFHALTLSEDDVNETTPSLLGDLRPIIPCEYVIDIIRSGPQHIVACGSHSASRADLVPVASSKQLVDDQRIVLENAHPGEVIRSVFVDEQSNTIFTSGEDGRIAAFTLARSTNDQTSKKAPNSSKKTPAAGGSKKAENFNDNWLLYDYLQSADNPTIRLNAKYDWTNIEIKDGHLVMKQKAYSSADLQAYKTVSIAGIQSRVTNMQHGTYRAVFKLDGSTGGSCAGFFWYHDDRSEIDIEIVTAGTSLVNNTISYTSHPSLTPDGTVIANASKLVSLEGHSELRPDIFHEYRFDSDSAGVEYFVDGKLVHTNTLNIPSEGGSLQMKLWADGNKWWSGIPSKTDMFLTIRSIHAYYNTTEPDQTWLETCEKAGGPSEKTICIID